MEIDIILNEFATPHEAAELAMLAESYGMRGGWSSSYALDRAIESLRQFAAMGLTEIALRVHDDPAAAIRLIGERVVPVFRAQ